MIEDETGAIYKLGQKVRVDAGDPQRVKITNMYLSKGEFDQLSVAPATIIAKSRWTLTFDGATFSVDEFKGRHAGLVLAEIELGENDSLVNMPLFAVADVTHDNEYSGGWLADASEADLLRVISELRNR
jgi:CYTH domain-containing protein